MAADPSPSPGPRDEDAGPVDDGRRPGAIDAGFLPRGGTPAPGRGGFASGGALETCPPGPALAGFAEDATGPRRDYPGLTDDELIGSMLAWGKLESWAGAGKLSAMAELSRRRAATGREAATRGGIPTSWSKYCSDEIAAALALSRWAAGKQLDLADALATRLPLTRRALELGRIDLDKAYVIAGATAVLDDAGAAAAEALVISHLDGKNSGYVRSAIGRAVLKVDPGAARKRREEAQKDARVELWREDAGTAALCGFHLPPDQVLAADQAITNLAMSLKNAGCPGTMDQLRARAYLDILLGIDTRRTLARGAHSAGHRDAGPPARDIGVPVLGLRVGCGFWLRVRVPGQAARPRPVPVTAPRPAKTAEPGRQPDREHARTRERQPDPRTQPHRGEPRAGKRAD